VRNVNALELSVAVCTRNRSASLIEALESFRGTPTWLRWELLVIDNASEDDTQAKLRSFAGTDALPLRVILEPEVGLAHARNRALREARSGVVVFIDDDVTCEGGVVVAHLDAFKDPTVSATGGRIIPRLPKSTPRWFRDEAFGNTGGPTARYDFGDAVLEVGVEIRPLPIGAHFGIRRNVALEHRGFDASLGWGVNSIPGEETVLLDRIRGGAGRILYLPDAIVHHRIGPERVTLPYFRQWFERLGRFEALRRGRPVGVARLKALARASFRVAKWQLRLCAERSPSRRPKLHRRLARARGSLSELIRPTRDGPGV